MHAKSGAALCTRLWGHSLHAYERPGNNVRAFAFLNSSQPFFFGDDFRRSSPPRPIRRFAPISLAPYRARARYLLDAKKLFAIFSLVWMRSQRKMLSARNEISAARQKDARDGRRAIGDDGERERKKIRLSLILFSSLSFSLPLSRSSTRTETYPS